MNITKIFYATWAVLFALFAYWQFNDPDPEVWVSTYVVAIIFCLFGFRGIFPKIPLTVLVVACLVGAVYFWPESVSDWIVQELEQKNLSMKTPQMDEARETFGLMIIALVMLPGLIKAWKK